MKASRALVAGIVLSLGLCTAAQAASDRWYVVGFGGQSKVQNVADKDAIDQALLDAFGASGFEVLAADSSLDDSDTAWGLTLGYQVGDYFATELSYVDLGEAGYQASGTIDGGEGAVDIEVGAVSSSSGPVLSMLGIYPFNPSFSIYGRFGLALLETEGVLSAAASGESDSVSAKTQRSSLLYGVGGEYSFMQHFGVRLEWTRYTQVGSDDIMGEADIDLYTLGFRYSF
ncbi:MAG: outer membrane beta-barrel protein [Gammaproteobacteria bacterium]|nr:outer membrane beta-barrel protein [Gammaproteobacteria bacterium]